MIRRLRRIGGGPPVPNLIVARRVLTRMASAAKTHLEDETGEALIGLLMASDIAGGVPTIVVLDTISPDDSALRLFHTFQQGDERQDELIWWLQENWRIMRPGLSESMKKYDVPLRYLGDWHKQPGFMIEPSSGDLGTALDWLDDDSNGMEFLLAPIVTLGHAHIASDTKPEADATYLMTPSADGTALRVDFWIIDLDHPMFMPLVPVETPNDQLPALPPYPWHLLDEARFNAEMRGLSDDGLFVSVTLWDVDGAPPLEVCLLTARVGAERLMIIVTPYDYPASLPSVRLTPFIHMSGDDDLYDAFARAWAASSSVLLPVGWRTEDGLAALVKAVEASLSSVVPDAPDADAKENA